MKKGYKKCPFCANEIREGATKCEICQERITGTDRNTNKDSITNKDKIIYIFGGIIVFLVILLVIFGLYFVNLKHNINLNDNDEVYTGAVDSTSNDDSSFQKNLECQKYAESYKSRYKDPEMIGVFYSKQEDTCLGYVYYVSMGLDNEEEFHQFIIEDAFDDRLFRFAKYEYQEYYNGIEPQCSMHSDYEGTKIDYGPCEPRFTSFDMRDLWEEEIERLKN